MQFLIMIQKLTSISEQSVNILQDAFEKICRANLSGEGMSGVSFIKCSVQCKRGTAVQDN